MRAPAHCIQITDDPAAGAVLAERRGADGLMFRCPGPMDAGKVLAALSRIRADHPQWWICVNERLDLALALPADALHVGFRGPRLPDLRRIWNRPVGMSVHDADEAGQAQAADYLLYGPVRDTPSKTGVLEPRGMDGLEEACRGARCPVLAVGGMGPADLDTVRARGAHGVAFIRGGGQP